MNFTLNDRPIDFQLIESTINFSLNPGVIDIHLNATVDVQNVRLLEDGFYRLLEDDSFRLLE